jgi:hypothetical protein
MFIACRQVFSDSGHQRLNVSSAMMSGQIVVAL